jgi:hypothetical protein
MYSRFTLLGVLIAATVGCTSAKPAADSDLGADPVEANLPALQLGENGESIRAAVAHEGRVLCLYDDGVVRAWDLNTGDYASEIAGRLTRRGLAALAADERRLWAADGESVYRWSTKEGWEKAAGCPATDQPLAALVLVAGSPLLVYPSRVLDPVAGRTFTVPALKRPHAAPLGILATLGTEQRLWIGTGRGEWGGVLLGLDPKAGTWDIWYDDLHYVTGITDAGQADKVMASWSMSHMMAHTLVRAHNADATVKTEFPEMKQKYFQRLTRASDGTLYAVESDYLVTVAGGKPTRLAHLAGRVFEREPHAVGVAPGILALVPAGPGAVVVVPKAGEPCLWRGGTFVPLRKP